MDGRDTRSLCGVRGALAGLMWLVAVQAAQAGAWMRPDGHGFYTFTASLLQVEETAREHNEYALFFEYGARADLTLGLSGTWTDGFGGEIYGFARWPLPAQPTRHLSYEVGLGANTDEVNTYLNLKLGVSTARGYWVGKQYGWMNLDTSLFLRSNGGATSLKIDGTIGLNVTNSVQVMGQALIELDENDRSVTWVPSVMWAVPGRETRIAIGLEKRVGRRASEGIRLGLWQDF